MGCERGRGRVGVRGERVGGRVGVRWRGESESGMWGERGSGCEREESWM